MRPEWTAEQNIPDSIVRFLAGKQIAPEQIGCSGAGVWMCEDLVLKIEVPNRESDNNLRMLRWLAGRLPVPEIVAEETFEGKRFLLMKRLPGEMSCGESFLSQPETLVELLAQGLRQLWSVDISGCPCDQRIPAKLENARWMVENRLYDLENVDPDTFGPHGFSSPEALLQWLESHPPEETQVLSHGDYCLPNVFLRNGAISGFLDLGRCGVSDPYADIALCWRSLRDNFNGTHGYTDPDFDPDLLFRKLEIQPDWEKIRYFLLLDELF